jgi:hypothetical protein
MNVLTRALMATLLSVSAVSANAETSAVEYLVQRKPLASTTVGSDKLVFRFFTDEKCEAATGEISLAASDSAIHFERLKGQRIGRLKGASYVRISAILTDAPANAQFMRVEGPGIVPAKTICQPQTVANAGVTGIQFVDTTITDQLLEIAGVDQVEDLRSALEKGEVPTSVVCELLSEVLSAGGSAVTDDICASADAPADPAALLGGLLDVN